MKKVFLDPNKIEFDGYGFKPVIKNEKEFWRKLKRIQKQFIKDVKKTGGPQ